MRQKFITMDDKASLALWDSEGKGEPIIFIHGFPENHHCWDSVFKHISPSIKKKYRLIAYDLRGFGESDKKGEASLRRFYKDHEAIVNHLGLSRYHVVGHDWGGAIAIHIARFNPDSLKSMVVLNTNYWETHILGMWHLIFLNLPFIPKLTFQFIPDLFFRFILWLSLKDTKQIDKKARDSYLAMFRDKETTNYLIHLYQSMASILIKDHIPIKLLKKSSKPIPLANNAYQVPTTLIWGKEDHYNPVKIGKNIQSNLKKRGAPVKMRLISGAGHFVQEEKPQEIAKYLVEHLKYYKSC